MKNNRQPDPDNPEAQEGESRREFIRKLPYIAPVVQTFLLSETAFGSDRRGGEGGGDEGSGGEGHGGEGGGEGDGGEGEGRGRRQVSPHTRGRGRALGRG